MLIYREGGNEAQYTLLNFPTPFHSLLIDSMSFLCRSIKSHWEQWLHDSVKVRLGQRQWQHQVTYCFQSRGRSENNGYNASL